MLEAIFGSINCERVLMYLVCREQGYASSIAAFYRSSLAPIQKQLEKLEHGGVLISRTAGRTRIYEFNPRYPFKKELKGLLKKALDFYPESLKRSLTVFRSRPRRKNKPV